MDNLAQLFAEIFTVVDDYVEDEDARHSLSRRFWVLTKDYDFEYADMDCDEALIHLGLARTLPDPEYPGDVMTSYDGGDI